MPVASVCTLHHFDSSIGYSLVRSTVDPTPYSVRGGVYKVRSGTVCRHPEQRNGRIESNENRGSSVSVSPRLAKAQQIQCQYQWQSESETRRDETRLLAKRRSLTCRSRMQTDPDLCCKSRRCIHSFATYNKQSCHRHSLCK